MEMISDGTLVMPSGCAMMDEEEMTYVEGGGEYWYKKSFSYEGKTAYSELQSSGNAAWALFLGGTGTATLINLALGVFAGAVSGTIMSQWADAYYDAAAYISGYKNSKKTIKFYEGLTGLKAHLDVVFTNV